jgi:hypothetical protein
VLSFVSGPLPVLVLADSEATGIANGLGVAGRPPLESSTSESRRAAAGVRVLTQVHSRARRVRPLLLLLSDQLRCGASLVAYSLAYIQSWPVPMNDPT